MPEAPPILVASDLSARSDRAVERALLLAGALDARVLLVHVVKSGTASDERVRARLDRMIREDFAGADRIELCVETGSVPATLARIARDRDCPLIVTGVARFNSPVDFVLGTAVDYLVRQSPVPVLVVRRRARAPYRRILALTDFSESAFSALEAADDFFPGVEIELVHVCEPIAGDMAVLARLREEAEEEMEHFLEELEESLRARVSARIEEGDIGRVVSERWMDGQFDLLALGTQGRGSLSHAAIGSRASRLLAGGDSDILMVRQ